MARRPTIADLAAAAGVSVATVDRVLNRRHPVRPATAERIARAAETIGFHAAGLIGRHARDGRARSFGFLLQKPDAFYRQFAADIAAAAEEAGARALVDYVDELSPGNIVEAMRKLADRTDGLAMVAIEHGHVTAEVDALAARGKPVVALITDLTAERRVGYVGRDNRKEGRTAAWLVAKAAGRPGRIGIIVGSHRYLCQETAEISFRSWFREHAPDFRLAEPLVNLDDGRIAYQATVAMMGRIDDLVGIYVCGGGLDGVVRAVAEEIGPDRIALVGHELTSVTRPALVDGVLTAVIATRTLDVARRAIALLGDACERSPGPPTQTFVPFDIVLRENL